LSAVLSETNTDVLSRLLTSHCDMMLLTKKKEETIKMEGIKHKYIIFIYLKIVLTSVSHSHLLTCATSSCWKARVIQDSHVGNISAL